MVLKSEQVMVLKSGKLWFCRVRQVMVLKSEASYGSKSEAS